MAYLYEMEPKYYAELLSANRAGVYDPGQQLPFGNIPADPNRRTVLIGLGGMGVETLDRIKGALKVRYMPGWQQLVSFLAVDTDRDDLNGCRHLTQEEMLCLLRPGMSHMIHAGPGAWPPAWHAIADETVILGGVPDFGTGGKRLVGRLRLYDQPPGQPGFDQQVVYRLCERIHNVLLPLPQMGGDYDIYVIGSLCGGSGSGMFLDFPVLIRRAMGNLGGKIHAVLYLPGIFGDADPARRNQFEANAYAALKELDYYQGIPARQGYRERWPGNDPAMAGLTLDDTTGLFQRVYLVDEDAGNWIERRNRAIGTVLEHLISVVANHTPPFIPAAPAPAGGEGEHGFLRHYAAGNTARAAVPKDILRAYVIRKLCRGAGLMPVSNEEYAALAATGAPLLPFRREDQYEHAAQLNAQAQQLLQPLTQFLYQGCLVNDYSLERIWGGKPTWEEIRAGDADSAAIRHFTQREIERLTSPEVERWLREAVQELFRQFRTNVRQYVEQYGPMAFVNLFEGRGIPDAGGAYPRGVRDLLHMLRDDVNPSTGNPNIWPTEQDAEWKLRKATREIRDSAGINFARLVLFNRRDEQRDHWCHAWEFSAKVRIWEARRRMLLGGNGIVKREFLEPAMHLTEQLYAFGKALETMAEIYSGHGAALTDVAAFQNRTDGTDRVNLGALFPQIQSELRGQMDAIAAAQNPLALRLGLTGSFFADPSQWMEIDDGLCERWNGGVRLRDA